MISKKIIFAIMLLLLVLLLLMLRQRREKQSLLLWQQSFIERFDAIQREARMCLQDVESSQLSRPKMLDSIIDFQSVENVWVRGPETKLTDDWLNFAFIVGFQRVQSNCQRCPTISKCLFEAQLSGARIRVCGLSWLKSRKRIGKHRDFNQNASPWHLGVIVPPTNDCKLIVGNQVFIHKEREWFTFGKQNNVFLFVG